ncbi:MAG TPA: VOC family protein [Pirellulales bacterium]|jgi:PhnB protein|nr:VOC family protein [Pirellulales bacterium]
MRIEPYLYFEGRAEEAIELYRRVLGAEVKMLMHFKDAPDQSMITPGTENKVMHASLRIGESNVMVSDGRCQGKADFQGVALSIIVNDESQADRIFAQLSEGGQVQMPLVTTFFSPRFGMVADRFGVSWMVLVQN